MNPEALQYSFDLFSKDGYSGSIEDYKNLISTDSEALDYSFSLFEKDGYGGTQEDFKVLLNTSGQGEVLEVEETTIQEPEVEENKNTFTPNPEGEAYYERLKARDGMMNAEVAAYENWKTENKSKVKEVENVKVDPVTNQPLVDVSEGVDTDYGLEINESNPFFNKDVSEDFVFVPKNKEANDLILKSDSLNKDTDLDINSIEYYYPDRFEVKIEKRGDDDLQIPTRVYYDTKETDSFGMPKEVDIQEFLGPIEKERRNKESQKLQNSYKGDVDAFVESKLEINSTAEKDLKEFYKIGVRGFSGELTDNAKESIKVWKQRADATNIKYILENDGITDINGKKTSLDPEDRKAYEEYLETGKVPVEKILRQRANAGKKAYDQDGNLIGVKLSKEPIAEMIVGQNGLNKDDITLVENKANELQEKTPTVDKLKELRNNLFFDQMVLGREIAAKEDKVLETEGLMNTLVRRKEQINEITGSGGLLGLLESDATAKEATSKAALFGKEGFVVGSLDKIKSNDLTALQYNENLIQLLAVNRAIELNSNLMTATEEGNISRVANRLYTNILNAGVVTSTNKDGESVRGGNTATQQALAYANVLQDAGLVVDEDILNEDINQTSFGEGTLDIVTDMAPLLVSIAATKKMTVGVGGKTYGVKPVLSRMDVIARTLGKGKSPALQKTFKLINGAAKEVVTIGAANEFMYSVFNGHKMPIQDAVVFGMGNSIVAGMSKYMLGKTIPYLSKYSKTKFGIGATVPLRLAAGGVTATSIGKANEGIQLNVNYWLGNSTEEEYDKGLEHLMDIQSWGQEIVAFTALGVRGEIFSDAKKRILDVDSRSKMTISAAKELGIKEFSTDKEIIDAKNKKLKEQGIAVVQSFGKKRTTEEQNIINNLNLAVETLRTQNTIVQSKEIIKNNTNDRLKTEERLDIIAQKVSSGQELNVEDIKEIGKFSDTPVGNENNGYNVRTPVEALSKVLASKLGIETSGQQFNNFQKALATNAQVSKIANIQFRGESKQTKSLRDDYIGKNLDLQKVLNEYNNLKRSVDANPEIASISKQLLRDTKSRLESIDKEMQDLVDKNREIEGIDFETDVAFVKAEAEKLGIGFEVMDARSFINAANKGKFSSDNTGVYVPSENKIYINRDAALEKGNVSVASHELAHALTRRAFKNANGTFTLEGIKTIDSFINDVMSNEQRSLVEDRISQNYNPESKDFKEKYYEEYLNVFLDGVKRGEFKMNDTFKQSLNSIFKSRNKVDLSTGQGIKNFIDILNRSSKKGSLDTRLKELYEAGEVAAEGEALTGEAPASKDAPRLTPLQEINKLIPKNFKVEGISQELKSKEDYDKYIRSRSGQSLVSSIYTPGGVINNYIRSRQESKAEGDKIIDNVADRLLNFNPESKRADGSIVGVEGFGESIFANTRFGKLDAKRDLAIEAERRKKTVSTDDEQARQIASTETTTKVDGEKAKVTPKSKVTRDFPEIFTEDLKNEIDISLLKIFTGDIPGVESKEFKSFITKASRGELTKKIKKALGGGKNYEFSVKKMAEKMKETLDPRFFVRLESQKNPENRIFTKPPKRLTKKTDIDAALLSDKVYVENLEQGVNIYEFKDFTPKQLSDYILAPTTSPTTGAKSGLRGTRKTAFAEGLVDRLTRDATPQNLKRIGKETGEIAEISKKMQVDPSTIMASKDLVRALKDVFDYSKGDIGNLTINSKEDLIKKYSLKGEEEKVIREIDVNQFRQAVENGLEAEVILSQLIKNDFASPRSKRVLENLKIKDVARREGITEQEVTDRYIKNSWQKNGLELQESLGIKAKSSKERGSKENFKKAKPYILDFIQRNIPKGKTFAELSKPVQNMLLKTLGMGDGTLSTSTKMKDGSWQIKGQQLNERPFTYKEYGVKEGEAVELLEKAFNLKNKDLIGKGEDNSSWVEDFYYPGDWGGKGRNILKIAGMDISFAEMVKRFQKNYKGRGQKDVAYETILKANERALESLYNSMKDVVVNSNNPREALEHILDLQLSQTNRASGGIKGLVGMESVTTKGEKSKPTSKDVHNEHLAELFSMTKDFSLMMDRYIKGEQNIENVNKQLKRMVEDAAQALITEKRRAIKDASGASVRDYLNNLIFLGKDAKSQIPLKEGDFGEVENMVEFIRDNSTKSFLNEISNTPYGKLTEAGIITKQQEMSKADYQKLKNQNIEVAKEASMASKDLSRSEIRNELNKRDKAFRLANERNKTIKKARVFDFDDTVARTNSKVFAERDGKRKVLTAEEFATKGKELVDAGWVMDFTDFNRVVDGKKGPLFELMKKMKEAAGDRDMFILTARAKESAPAIKEFLDAMGINIPLENITGLGNSTGRAKADWLVDKASEGYNDFYFADDAPQNVKAVQEGMSRLDVKSKTQLVKASKDLKIDSKRDKKKLSWKTDEAGNIKTTFEIAGKKYNFNLDARDSKGSFDVEFNLGGRIDMTGTGDAVKVIRTVYNGLLDVVSKNPKIKRLEFSSLKSETSRVKLYTALMDKVAKKLGWETDVWEVNDFIGENNSYDFEISKPRKKQVASVEKVLDVIDVKSETQQSLASKDLSRDFNDIIEQSTGIGAEKVFSDIKAEIRGNKARRQKFFIPPSAEDFTGLLYRTLGKGKKGEAQMEFYQENLLNPYNRAMENLSTDRVNLMADFKALKKQLDVPKDLKKITESGFTNEQAVRAYLWGKNGKEVPGISKTDMKELSDLVETNPKLKAFADQIMSITKGDGYSTPTKNWATGTITTDLIDVLNTTKRAKYLETWNQNKDIIFSKDNLNKLEAAYGVKYRESMENILKRMKSGRNRIEGGNVLSNKVLDYINNSTGAIMFFNTRSAVLQTISAANFINWGFNNPFRAGAAFANQPQYWKDFVKLINSDYLKDRRNGLKLNISESEIADAAKTSTNKAKAGINYILEKGYLPTKFADSFAIASGGATFYRNRINDLIKNEGLTKSEAEIRAMKEFREVSEISQQSSDPSKISSQQASTLGRVVLQFANTPMQYARIQKRAVQDIVNGRGDLKTNISKIAYYGFLQNMLFNSLQQGLFALGFGDDEIDDKEEQKIIKMANGMVDSSLRGLGFAGVTIQVLKNLGIDLYDRSKRDRPEYSDSYIKLLDFSPAVKSKLTKFRGAAYPFDSKKRRAEVFEKGFSLDNPAYESMAKVVTATTNLPLDRLYSKVNNLSAAMDDETETWQSIAMVLGWPEWQIKGRQNYVEAPKTDEEKAKIKEQKIKIKEQRSKVRVKEAKGSTDYETLKKLNKKEQVEMLLKLGYPKGKLSRSNFKEAELIEEIIKRNKK